MMSFPEISVITVVFNAVDTLEDTIKSVLCQTFHNLELIIVDGGSTDGTLDLLKRIDSPKLRWKSEPDEGIYDAMNKGIKMAKGKWIYFLGSDDTFYNNTVLYDIFSDASHENYDILYGNVYAQALKRKYDGEFSKDRLLFQNISHQAIFYKKRIFQLVGYYKDKYKTFADWNLNLECFLHPGIKVKYIDIVIANFAAGGLGTSQPDLLFLRDYLFPKNLRALNKKGLSSLRNIRQYDRWWRFLRSLQLDKRDELNHYSKNEKTPLIIKKMYRFQKRFPYRMICNGLFSKSAMFTSYCLNMITGSFTS